MFPLYFPQIAFSLHIPAAVYIGASASVFQAMEQERFRGKPRTNTEWRKQDRHFIQSRVGYIGHPTGWKPAVGELGKTVQKVLLTSREGGED